MSSPFIDLEYLQKLNYDRSNFWATYLDDIMKSETLVEEVIFDLIKDFSDHFDEESDDNIPSELSCMEDDYNTVSNDVLRNVANTTRFSRFFNNKTLAMNESNIEEEDDFKDVLDQTLPIINEHNRQLKEYGFDKILNTFDKKKIEDKVGSWLNRHNSLFGGDNVLLCDVAERMPRKANFRHEAIPESDDSLQSGETARYIRSSKAGATKHFTTTNTMIKTHRMVSSTRYALPAKYTFKKDYSDHHFKEFQRPRRISHDREYPHNHYRMDQLIRGSRKYENGEHASQKQRRKVFRKRIYSNDCSTMDSSDSDYSYRSNRRFHRKNSKHCCENYYCSAVKYNFPVRTASTTKIQRCALKMTSAVRNRIQYYSHSKIQSLTTSTSSSSTLCSSMCERRRLIKKRNSKFYNDDRPCKRETDCRCRNDRKLCEEYKHVANSSTEEWYVENCCSPKKLFKTTISDSLTGNAANKDFNAEGTLKANSSKDLLNKMKLNNQKTLKKKSKMSTTKNSIKDLNTEQEDDNDWELQMAIEASKKSYEKEEKAKLTSKKKSTTRTKKKVVEKLPKLVENEKEIMDSFTAKSLPTTEKIHILNVKQESFSIDTETPQAICNSTALYTKGKAYKRQIAEKCIKEENAEEENSKIDRKKAKGKNSQKISSSVSGTKKKNVSTGISTDSQMKKNAACTTVTSTTIRSPEICCVLSSDSEINRTTLINKDNCLDHNDCTVVTSTTNIDQSLPRRINEKFEDAPKQNPTSSSVNNPLEQMDIIIYDPNNRSITPADSFTSDGHFTITKEHLSSVIGEKKADKFLKSYIGRKRFNSNSTVYYRPPAMGTLDEHSEISSSDSDDIFDILGRYGDIYETKK